MPDFRRNCLNIIRQIPAGKVATYGQIAEMAGFPRHARQVGYTLRNLEADCNLPWHRVVNAQGGVSPRGISGSDDFQKLLLEAEGVEFGVHGRINLDRHLWQP